MNDIKVLPKSAVSAMTTQWKDGAEMAEFYNEWDDYEEELLVSYSGPKECANIVDRLYKGPQDKAEILDVAAGTGLVAEELIKKGFKVIDALEPSEGMSKKALEKNIYRKMYLDFFTDDVQCLQTDSYDVLVMVGALGEGHFPVNALPEMSRCVRPGGLVVIIGRNEFLTILDVYRDKLEPAMEQLEKEGQWTKLEKIIIPNYFFKHDGVAFVFEVTKGRN